MNGWLLQVPIDEARAISSLADIAGVVVDFDERAVWVRGYGNQSDVLDRLALIPGARRYYVWHDEQLQPFDRRIPVGRLPKLDWQPIAEFLDLRLPAVQDHRAYRLGVTKSPFVLIRSDEERPSTWLRTTVTALSNYADIAPLARLECCRYVANEYGDVLVKGEILPSIPGVQFVEFDGVVVPAGWTWQPHLEPRLVRELLGIGVGDSALFEADGGWHWILQSDWVRLTRSSIRQTRQAMSP